MASYISLLIIALAVSLDGCGVGLLYGVRRIRIPVLSLIIISFCSALVIWCSMRLGDWLTTYLPPAMAKAIGAVILVAVGIWAILQFLFRAPTEADRDSSGDISAFEAALLGIALSLDALGAGIGAAMVGFPALLTSSIIGIASGTFLATGLQLGKRAAQVGWLRNMTVIPGLLLIAMGILKLM